MVKRISSLSIDFQEGLLKNWRSKMIDGLHFTDDTYEKYLKNIKSSIKMNLWKMFLCSCNGKCVQKF